GVFHPWTGSLPLLPLSQTSLTFLSPISQSFISPTPWSHPSLGHRTGSHYRHHWFPEEPSKGSAYRCIRINERMDPLLSRAAGRAGLALPQLFQLLPRQLTLWVDPFEVSYRIGEDGSICVLYQATKAPSPYGGVLTCKNQMMLGRSSPSKNYIVTVSS
uniref:BTG anti-proliferation factor 2 n=1 Tax=Serinus canaria TaxID=9135 RepID=A0A8C9UE56_SERCA